MSVEERFAKYVEPEPNSGCWLWSGGTSPKGYGLFQVRNRCKRAHRVAYEMHAGPIPSGAFVCHRCDNPSCVNPEHLFLGSPADNMRDRDSKGRVARGEAQGMHARGLTKLTKGDVREIRRLLGDGFSYNKIAARFPVSPTAIQRIKEGRSWSWLT